MNNNELKKSDIWAIKDGIEDMSKSELKRVGVDIIKIALSFILIFALIIGVSHLIFTRQEVVCYTDTFIKSYEIFSVYNIISIIVFIILCYFVWYILKQHLVKKMSRINSIKFTRDFFLVNAMTILYIIFFYFYLGYYLQHRLVISMPLLYLVILICAGVLTIAICSYCYVFIKYFYYFFKLNSKEVSKQDESDNRNMRC